MTFGLRKYDFTMEKILPSHLFCRSFFRGQEMLRTTFPQYRWDRLFFEENCRTSNGVYIHPSTCGGLDYDRNVVLEFG